MLLVSRNHIDIAFDNWAHTVGNTSPLSVHDEEANHIGCTTTVASLFVVC